jgi:hypothetical protein
VQLLPVPLRELVEAAPPRLVGRDRVGLAPAATRELVEVDTGIDRGVEGGDVEGARRPRRRGLVGGDGGRGDGEHEGQETMPHQDLHPGCYFKRRPRRDAEHYASEHKREELEVRALRTALVGGLAAAAAFGIARAIG